MRISSSHGTVVKRAKKEILLIGSGGKSAQQKQEGAEVSIIKTSDKE